MSRCPTFTFQVSIMSKWLAKHISTKVSSKITIRKDMFTLTFVDLENETSISIWELEKMTFWNNTLPSFELVTRLNSQNRNETSLLMNSDTLICIWILAFPIDIIQVSTPRKWSFYFISVPYTITDLQPL